jgi:hypothetical protein
MTSRSRDRRMGAPAATLLVLCLLGLAACGGSSSNSTSASPSTTVVTETSLSTSSTQHTVATRSLNAPLLAALKAKLNAYAACMRGNGVYIGPPTTGPNGEPVLPAYQHATHEQWLAAFHKCHQQALAAIAAESNLNQGG